MQQPRTITRRDLYDLVWSKPMSTLAIEFGISDRGLAKVCGRHRIPVPPRGYWAKVALESCVTAKYEDDPDIGGHFFRAD